MKNSKWHILIQHWIFFNWFELLFKGINRVSWSSKDQTSDLLLTHKTTSTHYTKMYCLQWLLPVLLIPKPINPLLLYNHGTVKYYYSISLISNYDNLLNFYFTHFSHSCVYGIVPVWILSGASAVHNLLIGLFSNCSFHSIQYWFSGLHLCLIIVYY